MGTERKGTFKVEYLRKIESDIQAKWEADKVYEYDAPTTPRKSPDEKYFATFPYPYMNGRLHLGHTFSLSKSEFAVRYNRLLGKKVLFPLGFHCTGMPIKACADKLKREIELYGCPPKFPQQTVVVEETPDDIVMKDKSKGKKSKAVAKSGGAKYQWQIMQSLGLNDDEIENFANAEHWLEYFPPLAMSDLKSIGVHTDWRRTFITTDVNKFYDSFVRWQYLHLKERNKIKYGKRYTIFSPKDNQPCMDHDRSAGEGVGPQEYLLLKLKLLQPYPEKLKSFKDKPVFLVAATLRPETMYGQTNCWVHPDMHYIAYTLVSGDIFITTERAARNLAYQGFTEVEGKINIVANFIGQELIGSMLAAPNATYKIIYTLPMMTVRGEKGTGIVTSVPSDSPDDYAALMDLKKKQPLREKYGVKDEMILPYEPIPTLNIPEFGDLSAVTLYNKLKIQSQNDKEKLLEAKEAVYLKGFYDGVLLVGEYKGRKIHEVKKLIQQKLIDNGEAVIYCEPEKLVMSRSDDECVVALTNQWYLDYGEESWRKQTEKALDSADCFHDEVRKNFNGCLDWLHEYACSRTYGLGTRLPWDENWLIESLSDSTIYMAYYTIAHLLQGGTFKADKPNVLGIKAEQMTPDVWDYIFFNNVKLPKTTIKKEALQHLRREFQYWYPVDVRVSGKDLIQNHLTFYLYNHTAIWPNQPEMWPRAIRANGHLLLNSCKMSKSDGNFLTLNEAVTKFSADGMRLCLASAGDSIDDANFDETMADAGILRLYTFIEWVKEVMATENTFRKGEATTFNDKVFLSEMNLKIRETGDHYAKMLYKEALKSGFFELQAARDKYLQLSVLDKANWDLIMKYIDLQTILLSPICPHVSEHVRGIIGKDSVLKSLWPAVGHIDQVLIKSSQYLMDAAHSFRIMLKNHTSVRKSGKNQNKTLVVQEPNHGIIWVAKTFPPWQTIVLNVMRQLCEKNNGSLPENKVIASELNGVNELKKFMKRVMPFVQVTREKMQVAGISALNVTLDFNEMDILNGSIDYLKSTLDLDDIEIRCTTEASEKTREECCPGYPYMTFSATPGILVNAINPQKCIGLFTVSVNICQGNTVHNLAEKIAKKTKQIKDPASIVLYRYEDPELGPRTIPTSEDIFRGKVRIPSDSTFEINLETNSIKVNNEKNNVYELGHEIIYIIEDNTC